MLGRSKKVISTQLKMYQDSASGSKDTIGGLAHSHEAKAEQEHGNVEIANVKFDSHGVEPEKIESSQEVGEAEEWAML